ncbi:MAG: hypothetical protein JXA21_28270 [Anaerolineae bacterium]|nr:hypothetical protein [Anaerolineae bacterium]
MSDALRQELCKLVAHFGLNIVNNPRRCKAYLLDCCGKRRREIYALIAAQEEQIPARLLSAPKSVPQAAIIAQFTAHLVDSRPLDPAVARWAIETWIDALEHMPPPGALHTWEDDEETSPVTPTSTKSPAATKPPAKTQPAATTPATSPPATKTTPPPRPVPAPAPAAPFSLTPSKSTLDFGVLNDRNRPPADEFTLRNPDTQRTRYGTARSTLPWLEISPEGFACPPGQQVRLTARLTHRITRLAPKSYTIPDAVIVESSGQTLNIGLRLEIPGTSQSWRSQSKVAPPPSQPPAPTPSAKAPTTARWQIDFGTLSGKAAPLPEVELRLENPQPDRGMTGTIQSTLPWLEVSPGGFICNPNQDARLTVRLTKAVTRLRPKIYNIPDALIVQIGEQMYWVGVHLTVITE